MRRKQKKSLPSRRFGHVILIIITFGGHFALRSYIKHSKECFIRYPKTSKLVKNTRLRLVFSTHFSVFGYLMKHSSSCLMFDISVYASLTRNGSTRVARRFSSSRCGRSTFLFSKKKCLIKHFKNKLVELNPFVPF